MSRPKTKTVISRHEKAWDGREAWVSMYTDAYRLAIPQRNLFDRFSPGQQKNEHVYDSTLQTSLVRFANRMQSEYMPVDQTYLTLDVGAMASLILSPPQVEQMKAELEYLTKIYFAAIRTSNADASNHETWLDVGIGTGAQLQMEGDDYQPLNFESVPISEVALEPGPLGSVCGRYRKHKVCRRNIIDEWPDIFQGEDCDSKPANWDAWLQEKPDDEVEFWEASYLVPGNKADKPWYYDVFVKGSGLNSVDGTATGWIRCVARSYLDSPWVTPRWMRCPGETYGRGVVLNALPDAKVMNKSKEIILRSGALALAGVWKGIDDGVLNPDAVVFQPGAVINVGNMENLQRLEAGPDVQVGMLLEEAFGTQLRRAMLDDELPPEQRSPKSASEILQRIKNSQRNTGAPQSRIHQEWIQPSVQRSLNILRSKGVIQLKGLKNIRINGAGIQVRVNSPFAQAQNLNNIESLVQWIEINQAALGQEMFLLSANAEEIPDRTADLLNIDRKLVRKKEEREAIMKFVASRVAAETPMGPQPA